MSDKLITFDPLGGRMAEIEYLTAPEVARFLEAARNAGARDELVCRILLYTGMRIGECCPLTAGDVDAHKGTLTLSKVVTSTTYLGVKETHGGAKRTGKNPKTGERFSDRPAYDPHKVLTFLLESDDGKRLSGDRVHYKPQEAVKKMPPGEVIKLGLKATQPTRVVALSDRTTLSMLDDWTRDRNPDEFLWTSQMGGRISEIQVHRNVKAIMVAAEIPASKAHPHVLRHTYAVWYLKRSKGDNIRLARQLGHTNLNMTFKYSRLVADDLLQAQRQAGDLFRESET